jgi:phosphodiesterase/alkaline phosphatase D-like protein
MEAIKIICGPIIGAVTCSTARILVEVEQDCQLTMILTSYDTYIELTQRLSKKHPTIYKFINLSPSTVYGISFKEPVSFTSGVLAKQSSEFRTIPEEFEQIKLGFISCNSIRTEINGDKVYSLWHQLALQARSFDYLIHLGDQVYLDDFNVFKKNQKPENVFMELEKIYRPMTIDKVRDSELEIREAIQAEYRLTWTYEPIAFVLKNIPNYMMLDDHDIHDDFGFNPKFSDKEAFEFYFAQQARYCYYLYQRQLREDIDFTDDTFSKIEKEYYHVNIAGVCIYMLDFRGCRVWHKKENDHLKLGKRQWEDIDRCFGRNGLFSRFDCKCAIFVSTTPPVYISGTQVSELLCDFEDDVFEQWSLDCSDEQIRLLKTLCDFKLNTKKNVTLISGDVHLCGLTEIYRNDQFMFKQFITSGIKQKGFTNFQIQVLKNVINTKTIVNNEFSYKHENFSNDNNYGIIEVSAKYGYEIMCRHARSREEDKILPFVTNRWSLNRPEFRESCHCCSIF